MTSNEKKPPPSSSPYVADAKAKKRSRIIGRIIRYTVHTIFVALWAMVGLFGCIAIVDVAIKTEWISATSLTVKYRALVALVLMWALAAWVLKKALSKILESKHSPGPPAVPRPPLFVPPRFPYLETLREWITLHKISAGAVALVALFVCIALVSLAGKSTIITIQISTLSFHKTTIELPNLSASSIGSTGWIVLGVAVLLSIAVRPTARQLFFKALSEIRRLARNLPRF